MKAVQSESADKNELVFDLVGVDASIANALRRILLAEVCHVGWSTTFYKTQNERTARTAHAL